jgi:hypothetical protein
LCRRRMGFTVVWLANDVLQRADSRMWLAVTVWFQLVRVVFCTTAMAMVEKVQEAPVPVTPRAVVATGEYIVPSVKNRLPDGLGTCSWRVASLDRPTCVTTSPPRPRSQAADPLPSPSTASAGRGGALRAVVRGGDSAM